MDFLVDILSAFIWSMCQIAPWMLLFYLLAGLLSQSAFFPKAGLAALLWEALSGVRASGPPVDESVDIDGISGGKSAMCRALNYGFSVMPCHSAVPLLLGLVLSSLVLLFLPWDYCYYEMHLGKRVMASLLAVALAIALRMPLCGTVPVAVALFKKGFPGLAFVFLLLSPVSRIVLGTGRPRGRSYLLRALLLSLPVFLIGVLLCGVRVEKAGGGTPVLGISVTCQICGAVLCALIIRGLMMMLLRKQQ